MSEGIGHSSAQSAALLRLRALLDAELDSLAAHDHAGIGELIERKSQCLLELAAWRGSPPHSDRALLVEIKTRLERSLRLLASHLRAAKEVADLLARLVAEAECDGTYGRSGRRGGP